MEDGGLRSFPPSTKHRTWQAPEASYRLTTAQLPPPSAHESFLLPSPALSRILGTSGVWKQRTYLWPQVTKLDLQGVEAFHQGLVGLGCTQWRVVPFGAWL